MSWLYYANVSVHVLAAMIWLGGMLFLGLVGAPVLRSVEPPEARQRLFRDIGLRFRGVGWTAIAILVVTGIANLHFRGWLHWDEVLGDPAFWATGTGKALGIKLVLVAAMLVSQGFHDFIHGPRASALRPGSTEAQAARRRAMLLARTNAVIGVLVVIAAVRLAR